MYSHSRSREAAGPPSPRGSPGRRLAVVALLAALALLAVPARQARANGPSPSPKPLCDTQNCSALPPGTYDIPAFSAMSFASDIGSNATVNLPNSRVLKCDTPGTDGGGCDAQNNFPPLPGLISVPWPDVNLHFPIQFHDTGAGSDGAEASFSVAADVCLTPDQYARVGSSLFGATPHAVGDACADSMHDTALSGNWYQLTVSAGYTVTPTLAQGVLVGPDFPNAAQYGFKQTPAGGTAKADVALHWQLPFMYNTVRFHLIASGNPSANGQTQVDTDPVTITVLPAALVQLNVLPYTILYAPFGDKSSATYTSSTSFQTTMTYAKSKEIDNSWKQDSMAEQSQDIAATLNLALDGIGFGPGGTYKDNSKWDHTVSGGTGVATSTSNSFSHTTAVSFTVGSAAAVAGDEEQYKTEPFWQDQIVLLLHPQLGVWNFGGDADIQMFGSLGTPTAPSFARPTVAELDACAKGGALTGVPILQNHGITLSAAQCAALASLDPSYPNGQSVSAKSCQAGQTLMSGGSPRSSFFTQQDVTNAPYSFSFGKSYQLQTQSSKTSTYDAGIEDVIATDWTAGMSLKQDLFGAFSDNGDITAGAGQTDTNTTGMKLSYQQSNGVTLTGSETDAGTFQDDQKVYDTCVFYDNTFGTMLFLDPSAQGLLQALPPNCLACQFGSGSQGVLPPNPAPCPICNQGAGAAPSGQTGGTGVAPLQPGSLSGGALSIVPVTPTPAPGRNPH